MLTFAETLRELADHNSRPYPWKLAYDADWDILNQPRPQLAYRKIVWGGTESGRRNHLEYDRIVADTDYSRRKLISDI